MNNTVEPISFNGPGCRVYFFIQGVATYFGRVNKQPLTFAPGSTIVPKHSSEFKLMHPQLVVEQSRL